MKLKTKHILYFLGALMLTGFIGIKDAGAQAVPEVHYQFSVPTGSFRDFVAKPGPLGLGFQERSYLPNSRVSLGGELSWFYFPDKKGKQTLELNGDDGTYTGYVTNFTNIYGLQFLAQYDFRERTEKLVPYAKLALGLAYQNQRQDIGLLSFRNRGFQFLSYLEGGVRVQMRGQAALSFSATYHFQPEAGDVTATSFAGIRIGYSGFRFR